MTSGPASMENVGGVRASFAGGWWRDGYPLRAAGRWADRALTYEIGKRAHRCLVIENRPPPPPKR